MRTTLLSFLLVGAVCVSLAQQPMPPVPAAKQPVGEHLLAAKTMCLNVRTAPAANVAEARRELKAWGRFRLVEDCAKADVTLWITARRIPEEEACGAVMQVTNNSDQAILWTGNTKCKKSTAGTLARLVRALRKDVTAAAAPAPSPAKANKK